MRLYQEYAIIYLPDTTGELVRLGRLGYTVAGTGTQHNPYTGNPEGYIIMAREEAMTKEQERVYWLSLDSSFAARSGPPSSKEAQAGHAKD